MSRAFRYYLILSLVALGTSLAAVAGWRFARASAPVSGPIVLVTLDGISAERLPLAGDRGTSTPALDALATDGVVFERAYTHAPLTLPAHVSLLSGRLPMDTGVRDDVGDTVPASVRLVSSMLAERGYATAGVVSAFELREDTGLARGFVFFDDARPGDLAEHETLREADGSSVENDADTVERRVERWLSAAGTTRAFVFLQVSSRSDVAGADHVVGRLVEYLKKQQLYDQATVIVTSAHGEEARSRGHHGADLAAFDRVMHVPLVIKQVGSSGAGRRVRQLAQHADIVPTILDLAKAPTPSGLAGRSLRPLLEGQEIAERIAYGESLFPALHYGWAPVRVVSDGHYQYVSGATSALFDLDLEPSSRADVSAEHPEVTTRLARALDEWTRGTEVPAVTRASTLSRDERDAWLALGALGPRSVAGDPRQAGGRDASTVAAAASKPDPALVDGYAAAMREVANRRWTAAIDHLRALAKRSASRLDVWASLGSVAERAGRFDVAADAYRRVLIAAPMAYETRLRLASTLVHARRFDEARPQAELVTEAEEPALQAGAHELLARMALAKHEPGSARVHAQHVLEVDAASAVPAALEGRLLFERGRFDEAIEWFDKSAAQADRSPVRELHQWRAEALLKLERQAEAEDALLTELRLFPEGVRPYITLATLYHAQGRDDEIAPLLSTMTRELRTLEAFDAAARLWASFGDRVRADAARAEARGLNTPRPAITAQ
jgi:arylsulfatase A-like enzyme/tetratricopeptide (TPR) repeat protein